MNTNVMQQNLVVVCVQKQIVIEFTKRYLDERLFGVLQHFVEFLILLFRGLSVHLYEPGQHNVWIFFASQFTLSV